MKIFLISGYNYQFYKEILGNMGHEVINNQFLSIQEANNALNNIKPIANYVIITDEAIINDSDYSCDMIQAIIRSSFFSDNNTLLRIFTKNYFIYNNIKALCDSDKFEIVLYRQIFLRADTIESALSKSKKVFRQISDKSDRKKNADITQEIIQEQKPDKVPFLKKMFAKKETKSEFNAEDEIDRALKTVSGGFSRVIAITGHRGSGITSTVANLAYEANSRGISTAVVDLDINMRALNLYFPEFGEKADDADELKGSLIRCLAKPESYKTNSFAVSENLRLIGLPFDFEEAELFGRFFDTQHLISLISLLKQRFNLVLLDMPFEYLGALSEASIHIDSFGLCINNNLYSVITTLRCADIYLKKDHLSYLNSKAKIIVTKYNNHSIYEDERFTPEKVRDIMSSDLTDLFNNDFMLAGSVRQYDDFDRQIESESALAVSNHEFKQIYSKILVGIL